tara:strand:+ start:399 stop:1340 length:942 start_codon:yes stop_codon:yes gene_type:complete
MTINKNYLELFARSTEMAAYGAYGYIGKNDKLGADKAAVDLMRKELNKIDMNGQVVIGEGEMDEAPMLYIGENLGTRKGQDIDIAVDPLEGTNFVAKNLPNSFSVIAATEKNNLFSAPDTYMEKIAIGPDLPKDLIDLDNSIEKNISNLSQAKNKNPDKLTVCLLDRPRHQEQISSLKKMNVNLKLITDGDIMGVLYILDKKIPIDMYIGIGGGPEGVLAAAALSCYGAQMQTRLVLNKEERSRAQKMGIKELDIKYNIQDMIKGDVMFCATAITNGDLVNGVKVNKEYFETQTIALHKDSKFKSIFNNKYKR